MSDILCQTPADEEVHDDSSSDTVKEQTAVPDRKVLKEDDSKKQPNESDKNQEKKGSSGPEEKDFTD